jgi:hypothetical protein
VLPCTGDLLVLEMGFERDSLLDAVSAMIVLLCYDMFVLEVVVEVVEEVVFGRSLEAVMRPFILGEAWTTMW